MDFISLIKSRRSVRFFQEKKVDQGIVRKIIEMGTYAPSACNMQGWRFIIVDDPNKKQQIVDMGGSILIKNAPLGILVLYDNRTKNNEYADDVQSAGAAIQNLLLATHSLGLASCWLCHLPPKKQLRKVFNIPNTMSPVSYLIIGYPKNQVIDMPRKYSLDQIISYNVFSSRMSIEKINQFNLLIKKILIKIYWLTPVFIKKKWLNQYLDKNFVKKFKN